MVEYYLTQKNFFELSVLTGGRDTKTLDTSACLVKLSLTILTYKLYVLQGMVIVGFLVENDPTIEDYDRGNTGLFKGGGFYLLGVQLLACLCIIVWSGAITFILLVAIRQFVGLRLSEYEELMGADYVEHRVGTFAQRSQALQQYNHEASSPKLFRSTSFSGEYSRGHFKWKE